MSLAHTAIIALGSNLHHPIEQVRQALSTLEQHPHIQVLKTSSLYRTAPVGYADQPDFINAVCWVETTLSNEDLLHELNRIEAAFGRARSFRNAPRTLDLDIIDYAQQHYTSEHLVLPHPRAHERSFVMKPLAEIAPDYPIGTHGNAAALAAALGDDGIYPL